MGASSDSVEIKNNNSRNNNKRILNSQNNIINNNDNIDTIGNLQNLEGIKKIPNDQYTCTECSLVPEILNIDYEFNEIEFKCKVHGTKKLSIKDYFIQSSKYSYYNYKCQNCNSFQKDTYINEEIKEEDNDYIENNIIFKYCYECRIYFALIVRLSISIITFNYCYQ